MPRALPLAVLCLLAAVSARGFDEPAVADRNLGMIVKQLETGSWTTRIQAVHELEYMYAEGLPGLSRAVVDGDWQVRLTAVHALGSLGATAAPTLKRVLKNEPCPVVRLMTLHALGSFGPEGEEAKAMGWIEDASTKDVNACRDQAGPGLAPWARSGPRGMIVPAARTAPASAGAAPPRRSPRPASFAAEPEPVEDAGPVTRDPVPQPKAPPAPAAKKPARAPETLGDPTKFQRRIELDAILDMSTAPAPAPAPARRGVSPGVLARRAASTETLPLASAPLPREHSIDARARVEADAGTGKAAHDAVPSLLRALKSGDARVRSRAADDLGHLGAKAAPAIPALMAALRDKTARVRSSAGLALGNIGGEHPSVVPLLVEALRDKDEDVHYAAALALSRIGTPEARAAFNRHVDKEARAAIDRPAPGVR